MSFELKKSIAAILLIAPVACETSSTTSEPQPAAAAHGAAVGASTTGKVVETMNSGGYTYVRVDDGTKQIWAAGPEIAVKVGDTVTLPRGLPMKGFESKTLGRTFDTVYFVNAIRPGSAAPVGEEVAAAPPGESTASPHGGAVGTTPADLDVSGIAKVDGGHTVAELFAGAATLAGKQVAVRGKVAKFTGGIMGKNWIHLQDGTGDDGSNDMTVTTSDTAKVGDTVVVRGKLATDRDFGFGYQYDVMLEDATLTVE